jgi:hypothetical protein
MKNETPLLPQRRETAAAPRITQTAGLSVAHFATLEPGQMLRRALPPAFT